MGILNRRAVEAAETERAVPDIRTGDIVEIKLEVPENRRRASIYKGLVLSKQNAGIHTTIQIRRIIAGIGVEIVFPVYGNYLAYGQSKLANILHTNELSRRFVKENVNITANSLHPGVVVTDLFRQQKFINAITNTLGKMVMKSVEQELAEMIFQSAL